MSEAQDHKWRDTILAGLANYIDAGSIVAGSVALGLWKEIYGLSDGFIGLIGAFSANQRRLMSPFGPMVVAPFLACPARRENARFLDLRQFHRIFAARAPRRKSHAGMT